MSKKETNSKKELAKKLNNLHRSLLDLCIIHSCNMPEKEYEIKNNLFFINQQEIYNILLGKLCTILFDYKRKNYNTISYSILITDLEGLYNLNYNQKETLDSFKEEIEKLKDKFQNYRNKLSAHIELDEHDNLIDITKFQISNKKITEAINLAKKIDSFISKIISGASTNFMETDLNELSAKIFESYENISLVKLIEKKL
jgi:hypothetical protein